MTEFWPNSIDFIGRKARKLQGKVRYSGNFDVCIISVGRSPGAVMPSLANILTLDEVNDLSRFAQSLPVGGTVTAALLGGYIA